jgi:hypothetical protein
MTSLRLDRWTSLDDAKAHFLSNKFYKSWDPRALDKYLEVGLRPLPTALYPEDGQDGAVTLTTTKAQEAWSYVRSTFTPRPSDDRLDEQERKITAELTAEQAKYVFHRPESGAALRLLPTLQPAVKWIFGTRSYINRPAECAEKIRRTGQDARGSGGVTSAFIKGGGHLVALEMIAETADAVALHIAEQLVEYSKDKSFWTSHESEKSDASGMGLSSRWKETVRQRSDILRPLRVIGKL